MKRAQRWLDVRVMQAYLRITGTTQTDLAEKAGIGESYLSALLARKRRLGAEALLGLADATGLPLDLIEAPHV